MDCTCECPLLQVGIKKRLSSQSKKQCAQCRHYHHRVLDLSGSIHLQFFTWALGGDFQRLGLCKEQLSPAMLC